MKMHFTQMLSVCCAIMLGVFSTTDINAQCLEASFGQWPEDTFTPACDGSTEEIPACTYTDEYSVVAVTNGETYTFTTDDATQYITISADEGATAAAFGTGSVTWTATADGEVRFYSHLSDACDGSDLVCTSRSVACGEIEEVEDCLGVLGGDALPGTACDDEDPLTEGSTWNDDCECTGGVIPLANDNCGGAIPLVCDEAIPGNSAGAISSGLDADCGAFGASETAEDVWYSFTADGSSDYTVTVLGESNYDAVLYVYSGDCGSLVDLGCSDVTFGGGEESVELSGLEAGTYYVRTYDWFSGGGDYTVSVACSDAEPDVDCLGVTGGDALPGTACDDEDPLTEGSTWNDDCECVGGVLPIANDDCEGAIALACDQPITGSTDGATASGLDATCGSFASSDAFDLFYTFEADGTSNYTVSLDELEENVDFFDGVLFVYSGSCGDLTDIGCSDSGSPEEVELTAPDAGTYTVRIFDYTGTSGFSLSLTCTEVFECGDGNVGDPCDDGDENTIDDVYVDGCDCVGTVVCEEPFPAVDEASLSTTFLGDSYLVEWEPVEGQIGCQLQLRTAADGETVRRNIVLGEFAGSQTIPPFLLDFATDYEWRVRCGCSIDPIVAGPFSSWQPFTTPGSEITSSPNPTDGQSTVSFTVVENGYTTLEVFDLSGRVIDGIFTGNTQPNNEYRFEFDGSALPNGVYIYRLTTESEVLNQKFMIAK